MANSVTRATNQTVRAADQASAAFTKELARILRETERQIRDLLARGAEPAVVERALRQRAAIRKMLSDAGYDDLVQVATSEPLDRVAERVLAGRQIGMVSRARLEAMKSIHWLDLLEEGETLTKLIWRATIRGTFGTTPVPDLVDEIARILDTSESRIQTIYDTAVSIYGRQVESEAASDDPQTVFAYMGPVDGKTRDFCVERVGKVFTRAQIDEMDNGQIANVFLSGGGWNCRHVWHEISKFSEGYDLLNSGDRFPEVQQDIDDLKEAA